MVAKGKKRRFRWVRWLIWSAVFLAIAITVGWRVFLSPERLKLLAQARLSQMFDGKIYIGDARFALRKGIVLRKVYLEDVGAKISEPVIGAEQITVTPRWGSLLRGKLQLKTVTIDGLKANIEVDEKGRFPIVSRLHIPKTGGGAVPKIAVDGGEVKIVNSGEKGVVPDMSFSRFWAQVQPDKAAKGEWSGRVIANEPALGTVEGKWLVANDTSLAGKVWIDDLNLSEKLAAYLPASARQQWENISPNGEALIVVGFWADKNKPGEVKIEGNATLQRGSLNVPFLRDRLEQVSAKAEFDNHSVKLADFTGKFGATEVAVSGTAERKEDKVVRYDVTVSANNLLPKEVVAEELPDAAKKVYASLKPEGSLNLTVRAQNGAEGAVSAQGELEFVSFGCAPAALPYALKSISGHLVFADNEAWADNISGKIGDLDFALDSAYVSLPDRQSQAIGSAYGLRVKGPTEKLLGDDILNSIPEALKGVVKRAEVSLAADIINFKIPIDSKATAVHPNVECELRELALFDPKLGDPIKAQATATYSGDGITVLGLSGTWGSGQLSMPSATFSLAQGIPRSLSGDVSNLKIDERIKSLLSEKQLKFWNEYQPSGVMDIDYQEENDSAGTRHSRASIMVRDGGMRYALFPYPLSHLAGQMQILDNKLERAEFNGSNGNTHVTLTIHRNEYDGKRGRRVIIRAADGSFGESLKNALPQVYVPVMDSLKPEGRINLNVEIQHYWDAANVHGSIFTAQARFSDLALGSSVPIQSDSGEIVIDEARQTAKNHYAIRGHWDFPKASVERLRLEHFTGRFRSEDSGVRFENISADCYDGVLDGEFSVVKRTDNSDQVTQEFDGSLYLVGANVKKIAEGREIANISGTLSGSSRFHGNIGSNREFSAVGAMAIRNGQIGELPSILAAFNLLQLKGLGAPAFHALEMNYTVQGSILIAKEMNFYGPIMSLYGKGKMLPDGKLSFTFLPELGPKLPPIPGLKQIIDQIKGAVVAINVEGDYSDPVWQLNPALSLTRTIRDGLFGIFPLKALKPKNGV